MTTLIILLSAVLFFSFLFALTGGTPDQTRAGTTLTVWAMILLTLITLIDKVVDL